MIKLASDETKQEVRQMWKTCFEDSDEFMDLYFSEKYQNENTLIYFEKGKAAASLQMLPYQFTFCDVEIPISYISGACTLPEYRNRRYMGKLLLAAFDIMQERNIPLSILTPAEEWLYDYYTRYGYETVFELGEKEIPLEHIVKESNGDMDAAYSTFDKLFRNRDFCIQKTKSDFITIVKDVELDGFPPKKNLSGMARIINANRLLSIHSKKYPEKIYSFKLNDKIIKRNIFYYETDSNTTKTSKTLSKTPICIDSACLCRLLFGFRLNELPKNITEGFVEQHPIMNLMLE